MTKLGNYIKCMSKGGNHEPRTNDNQVKRVIIQPVVLFTLKDSLYKQMGLDCYDEERDATTYEGNRPVIAHPPCQLWGALAAVNYKRWGGEHNRPGNDGGLFKFALATVRRVGGVLEHPAKTRAWKKYRLQRPSGTGWKQCDENEWVCEVWQSAYGHKANKATWLHYVGKQPIEACWDRPKGTHQIGFYDQRGKGKNKPTLTKKEANETPQLFADYLVRLAQTYKAV